MIETSEFKKGIILKIDGQYWETIEVQFTKPGKGMPFYKVIIKNLENGKTITRTYKSGRSAEDVDYDKRSAKFLYKDRQNAVFLADKERISIPLTSVGDDILFLKENEEVHLLFAEEKCLKIMLPAKVDLKVTEAPPTSKGNTAGAATKTITLETGLETIVPDFINEGDIVRINTETKKYTERL